MILQATVPDRGAGYRVRAFSVLIALALAGLSPCLRPAWAEDGFIPVTVHSDVQLQHADDPYTEVPAPNEVVWTNEGSAPTDSAGFVALPASGSEPRLVTSELRGLYCDVDRADGPDATWTAVGQPGVPLQVTWNDTNSRPSERDGYDAVNRAHDWVKRLDPGFTALDHPVICTVNTEGTCIANYIGGNISFSKANESCVNMAQMEDAVIHVYSHGITDATYAPGSPPTGSGIGEGLADCLAMTITNNRYIAEGIFNGSGYLRDGMNTRLYPGNDCGGNIFCLGEILMGSMWRTRQALIDHYGTGAVQAIYDPLLRATWKDKAYTMPDFLMHLLTNDDDNGDLGDGTPHWTEICGGFAAHNLPCPSLLSAVADPPTAGLLRMEPAQPNPFVARTALRFTLAEGGPAQVELFDASGRIVRRLVQDVFAAGAHRVEWDGRSDQGREVPPGIYFCRISAAGTARQGTIVRAR